MKNWKIYFQDLATKNFKFKKPLGIILIIAGFLALVTPFTPGSWLIFVGLELLGIRLAAWEKIKAQFLK